MWEESDNSLSVELEFKDFVAAFKFMGQVAELAEAQTSKPTNPLFRSQPSPAGPERSQLL